ncbi:MAG: hypothetical protein AMS22_17490 [Thiotrichales bacterium SG8_50]|nr:MAG: hypothetical protein AMS22_17490 [Thiotrichales bacterium SG8_50]KPL28582.1 MAG: hypothetical protein AMJ72_02600 [Acidithiobacillales bacterium SM1_46]
MPPIKEEALMRSMKTILAAGSAALVLGLAVPVTSWAARTETMYNPDPIAVPCNNLSNDKIRTAVRESFLGRGWVPTDKGANALEAKLQKKYEAVVTASWTTKAVTVKYKSSEGLSAEGDQIHRNYNKWIRNIERDIALKLSRACG